MWGLWLFLVRDDSRAINISWVLCVMVQILFLTALASHTQGVCTDRLPKTESGTEDLTSLVTGKRDQKPPKVILKLCPCLGASKSHTESVTANQQHELTSKSESIWVQDCQKLMENHPEISSGLCGWKPIILGSSWESLMRMRGVLGCKSHSRPRFSPELSLVAPGTGT